jgi:hypothetical protein
VLEWIDAIRAVDTLECCMDTAAHALWGVPHAHIAHGDELEHTGIRTPV